MQTKTETREQAGIPWSTAYDYEQLIGGREEQGQKAATHAAEGFERFTRVLGQAAPPFQGLFYAGAHSDGSRSTIPARRFDRRGRQFYGSA